MNVGEILGMYVTPTPKISQQIANNSSAQGKNSLVVLHTLNKKHQGSEVLLCVCGPLLSKVMPFSLLTCVFTYFLSGMKNECLALKS